MDESQLYRVPQICSSKFGSSLKQRHVREWGNDVISQVSTDPKRKGRGGTYVDRDMQGVPAATRVNLPDTGTSYRLI